MPAEPAERFCEGPVLGIETSGTLTGAALVREGRLLAESAVGLDASRQELLMELIERLLATHGLGVPDLARIGVSLGPGSFTGLRVGLAAARALGFAAEVPLLGVPTHQALALPYRGLDETIVLLTGYRRGQVCLEVGRWPGGGLRWEELISGQSVPVEAVGRRLDPLADPGGGRFLFLGEAVQSALEACSGLSARGRVLVGSTERTRLPGPVALWASVDRHETVRGAGAERLEPIYLRPADAKKPKEIRGKR